MPCQNCQRSGPTENVGIREDCSYHVCLNCKPLFTTHNRFNGDVEEDTCASPE